MSRPVPTVSTTEEPESLLPGDMRPVERMQRAIRRPSERFRREARQVKREKVAVRLANAAAHLVAWVPGPLRDMAVDMIGAIWIRSTPHYRDNVMANIGQVLGPDVSQRELEQIAKRERCSVRQINLTISLAFLAPDLVRAAVEGRLPRSYFGSGRLADRVHRAMRVASGH